MGDFSISDTCSGVHAICPENCNGHGKCVEGGMCVCEAPYTGESCNVEIADEVSGEVADGSVAIGYSSTNCWGSGWMLSSVLQNLGDREWESIDVLLEFPVAPSEMEAYAPIADSLTQVGRTQWTATIPRRLAPMEEYSFQLK